MSKKLTENKVKTVAIAVVLAITITSASANQVTENQFFTSEEDQINEFTAFLLQEEPTQTEEFSELTNEGANNEDAQLAINIYQRTETGERNTITEETALLELDANEDNDGERETYTEQFTFPQTNLEPEDTVEIEILASFNDNELQLLEENEQAQFTRELQATNIEEQTTNMIYDIEYDSGQGGQNEGQIRFYFGDDTNPQGDQISQIEDLNYEIPPPEINLIQPEDEETFQSGEQIEYEITDEYREINNEETFYTLDGEERDFDEVTDSTYIIDTTNWDEGERNIEVFAENEDGATETQQNTFTIDDTPPEVNIQNPDNGEITNEEEITVEYTVDDENEIVSEEIQINNQEREPINSGDTIELEEDGEYDLTIFAEDEAGNEGQDTNTFTLDTEDPELTVIEPEDITYDSFDIPVEIDVDGEDTVEFEVFDSNDEQVKQDTLETETTTLNFEEEGRDTYEIEITAEDEAGNTDTESQTFTVDPDPAVFETQITDTNRPVDQGEILEVDYNVENTGDVEETRDIEFIFDGTQELTEEITLDQGEQTDETFEFDTESQDTGDYIVEVVSGEQEVEQDEEQVSIGDSDIQLENVQIFDVTDTENERDNGELQGEGTSTIEIEQEERNVQYRFDFTVQNNDEASFYFKDTETIQHEGINQEWTLEDIFKEQNSEIFEGGQKTETEVQWNPTEATIPPDEEITLSYIVETDTTESNTYNTDLRIESLSQETNLEAGPTIDKTKFGFLEVNLQQPPQEFTAAEDSSFDIITETTCLEGECGTPTKEARYNETGTTPQTLIPEDSDNEPVYSLDSNPQDCENELTHEETCTTDWEIQVTGEIGETVALDSLVQSNLDEVDEETSETSIFTIQDSLILDVEFEEINFGTVSPGKDEQEATQNDLGYNLTIPENSLEPSEIRVNATDLDNGLDDGYNIPIENMGFSLTNDEPSNQLSNEKQLLTDDITTGQTIQTYYWLDIPTGITADTYTGVINFEAIE